MTSFLKKYGLVLLLVLGVATRFGWFWYPSNVVWDEQHFCNFTKGYLEGKYFFDIHPPLGKLILLGGLKLGGATTKDLDCTIGNPYPTHYPYLAARFIPTLAGSLLPAIIYLLARALTLSPAASFLAGAFLLFDNAITTESRFALIDIFVPFFAFLALLSFTLHRKKSRYSRGWWAWLLASGLCGALAAGVKWTGSGALFAIGAMALIEAGEDKTIKPLLARIVPLIALTLGVQFALYAAHFALLPKTGPGDAFMTERFRTSLADSVEQQRGDLTPPGFIAKFLELNKKMFAVNAAQKLSHQDSSRFYEWPIGRKQIYFWVNKDDNMRRIYLRANPVVWLFGAITTLGSILYLVFRRKALQQLARQNFATQQVGEAGDAHAATWRDRIWALLFLYIIFLVNWIPFAAVTRAMFLYHYFSSLIASLLIGVLLVFHIVPQLEQAALQKDAAAPEQDESTHWVAFWILLALSALAFVLFSPLTYGYKPPFG